MFLHPEIGCELMPCGIKDGSSEQKSSRIVYKRAGAPSGGLSNVLLKIDVRKISFCKQSRQKAKIRRK